MQTPAILRSFPMKRISPILLPILAAAIFLPLSGCVTHDRQMYRQKPWRNQKADAGRQMLELPPGDLTEPLLPAPAPGF
jgi:hypothetical protein